MNSISPNPTSETNSVERSILINASREKVWRALTTAEQFGIWFGVDLKGQTFAVGEHTRGIMGPECGHEDAKFDVVVERIEPQHLFSYRWHPYSLDQNRDYSKEERTLVVFTLEDVPTGTLLKVVESGFDKIPADRRSIAFSKHSGGWEYQLNNIARYANN